MHHEVGRVLSTEEKLKLQTTAVTNPDWENAYLAMTLCGRQSGNDLSINVTGNGRFYVTTRARLIQEW